MSTNKKHLEKQKNMESPNFKISIVDNDESLKHSMQLRLEQEGYPTELSSTGADALNKIKHYEDNILLINNNLTDIKGIDLIKKTIRKFNRLLPIIIYTDFRDEKLALESIKLGLWDYIVKGPHFLDILTEKVKFLCENIQRNNQLKKTGKELRKSLEVLKETGEMARVGGWEVDLKSNTVYWTQSTKMIHEVPDDYVPKLEDATAFFPGESRVKLEKAIKKATQTGIGYNLQLQFVSAKGKELWVHTIGKAKLEDGKCTRLYGTFQDITKRKKAVDELKTRNLILQRTEKIAQVGSWEWEIGTDTVIWSDELFNFFRLDPKMGTPKYAAHDKLFTAESKIKEEEAVKRCIQTGKPFKIDLEIKRSDGETGYCTSWGFLQKDENGKPERLFGSFQDITDRKKVEDQLKALNQQLLANEQQLRAANQQLQASEQELQAANQQLKANEKQLRAAVMQLQASEQQLRAANLQLIASENELRSSKETAERYLNIASEIILSLDTNGNIILMNESGHKLLGYEAGQLIGQNWFDTCVPQKHREAIRNIFVQTIKNEIDNITHYESIIENKSGELKTILWHNSVLKDKSGKITGVLSSGEDISERVKTELDLLQAKNHVEISEERFRKSQEAGHIGSWEFNLKTGEFWGSDEGKRIYNLDLDKKGFPVEDVMEIVAEKDREKVNQAMIDLVSKNKAYDIIFEITPKNTSEKKIINSIAELHKDKNGVPHKVSGVLLDITLQKEIEDNLIDAKEKAEEADRLKSAFLANMSHEIRTPMNGILGFTDLLQEPSLSGEEQQKYINIIQKSGNRMLNTVNNLIDISKIETGQMEVTLNEVNISNELENQFHFFQAAAENKGIKLTLTNALPESCNLILTDAHKFNSILTNLIKNALKYTDEGFIHLACIKKDSFIEFSVNDSGIGVPEDRQKAIFDRFIQADIADTRALEGSGLGLTISKAYAEMMGGKLWMKSEEGVGSTFYFTIPLPHVSTKKPAYSMEEKITQENLSIKKLTILVAEDDEVSFQHLAIILKDISKEIIHAENGIEAVDLCKQNQGIDLVLMDIKMPGIDGYEATKRIRAFDKEVIIMAQTAFALTGDYEKAIDAGCNDYVSKPISKKDLILKINKLFFNTH